MLDHTPHVHKGPAESDARIRARIQGPTRYCPNGRYQWSVGGRSRPPVGAARVTVGTCVQTLSGVNMRQGDGHLATLIVAIDSAGAGDTDGTRMAARGRRVKTQIRGSAPRRELRGPGIVR
jgi:hypothetical protein